MPNSPSEEPPGKDGVVKIGEGMFFYRAGRTIVILKRETAPEDDVALKFSQVLEDLRIPYAVVAGYVAILFGRSRRSDYIDFIVKDLHEEDFVELCRRARKLGYNLMQGDISSLESIREIYNEYLAQGYGIRFMYGDLIVPNIEFKLASTSLHHYSIDNSIRVIVSNIYTTRVAPIELQIAYKLYLSSDKDLGDAIFLYSLLKEALDQGELDKWCRALRVDCNLLTAGGG